MNQFVTTDWLVKETLAGLKRSLYAGAMFNRPYDEAFIKDADMPTFDHIPTEAGREASRRLWRAAGRPKVEASS